MANDLEFSTRRHLRWGGGALRAIRRAVSRWPLRQGSDRGGIIVVVESVDLGRVWGGFGEGLGRVWEGFGDEILKPLAKRGTAGGLRSALSAAPP